MVFGIVWVHGYSPDFAVGTSHVRWAAWLVGFEIQTFLLRLKLITKASPDLESKN
jgi:hypothetical protein